MIFEISIPPDTLERTPVIASYDVGVSQPKQVTVRIPDGHKNLARLKVTSKGQRLAPDDRSGVEYVRGNDDTFNFPVTKILEGPPYTITLTGWNEDDTYPHGFAVEVTI